MKIIGYIRVSTEKQNLENQKLRILEYAQQNNVNINSFLEIEISSKKSDRERKVEELKGILEENDILICTELSRLGRNMLQVLNLIEYFNNKKVKIVFTNQPELSTNGDSAISSLLLSIYGYFAQAERELISERTKQGLVRARAQGNFGGRRKGQMVKSIFDEHRGKIEELCILGLSANKIVKYIEVGTQQSLSYYIKSRGIKKE